MLVRPQPADPISAVWLQAGDRIAFEVVDPGDLAAHRRWVDRDPLQPWPTPDGSTAALRDPLPSRVAQVVELLSVTPFTDPLAPGLPLVQVAWSQADALLRSLSRRDLDRTRRSGSYGARAGTWCPHITDAWSTDPREPRSSPRTAPQRRQFDNRRVVAHRRGRPAQRWRGPFADADGFPYTLSVEVVLPSTAHASVDNLASLLDAVPGSFGAVVDTETFEPPVLRFVTGALGPRPPAGSDLLARYEVGSGAAGNVPANVLRVLEHDANVGGPIRTPVYQTVPGVIVRNPVAASGGSDPDDLDAVRRDAPEAFVAVPRRAVLAADLAVAATADPAVRQQYVRVEQIGR